LDEKKDKPVGEEEKWGAEEINAASFHSSLSLAKKLSSLLAIEAVHNLCENHVTVFGTIVCIDSHMIIYVGIM
jgi:hypothetical protein